MRYSPLVALILIPVLLASGCSALLGDQLFESLFTSEQFRGALVDAAEKALFSDLPADAVVVVIDDTDANRIIAYVLHGVEERRAFLFDQTSKELWTGPDSPWVARGIPVSDVYSARQTVETQANRIDTIVLAEQVWDAAVNEIFSGASSQVNG